MLLMFPVTEFNNDLHLKNSFYKIVIFQDICVINPILNLVEKHTPLSFPKYGYNCEYEFTLISNDLFKINFDIKLNKDIKTIYFYNDMLFKGYKLSRIQTFVTSLNTNINPICLEISGIIDISEFTHIDDDDKFFIKSLLLKKM